MFNARMKVASRYFFSIQHLVEVNLLIPRTPRHQGGTF